MHITELVKSAEVDKLFWSLEVINYIIYENDQQDATV